MKLGQLLEDDKQKHQTMENSVDSIGLDSEMIR